MNVIESDEKINPSNNDQIAPLLPTTFNATTGLNCLRMTDSLYVKQLPSMSEIIFGIASEAKFDIYTDNNVRMLQALETSSFWQRFCCSTRRHFTLRIIDNSNQDVILIKREFKCCSGCCWCANTKCCSQEVIVESPPGTLIGTVAQQGSCCRSIFAIKDSDDNHVLTVRGPLGVCDGPLSCRCENKYFLIGTDGTSEVGFIQKKYRGILKEILTSADAYLLKVPMDLDVKMKAMSLAALFLIVSISIENKYFRIVYRNHFL
ncbi:unnamed protein product [Rotaria sp. Silwood2]|nr:unnamed protein product [Rotaria sp. Silwood2]CAF2847077.1 unnamed protein product [Rotaria sp. Silwood2]CAF4160892.1 unnamed protein product [Rotaria sp. Silwood2]